MGQPAARMGDLTAHGGAITVGNPTVLIGGAPAATLGDLHVCPMCSPGPHVGGPISGGAPTVLIGGKPAARMGDMCVCAAPAPDVIVGGAANVLIGGGGGSGGGGAAAAASGASAAAGAAGLAPPARARPVSPWVGVAYVDKSGRPVARWDYEASGARGEGRAGQVGSGGQVWLDALAEGGDVEIGLVGAYACRWAQSEARVGEAVEMSAKCVGVANGTGATFEVWRESTAADGSVERAKVWEVPGAVRGGRVTPEAPYEGQRSAADAEEAVRFVAEVVVAGRHRACGGELRLVDSVAFALEDDSGERLPRTPYRLTAADGHVRTGRTDGAGEAVEDDVPLGAYRVEFEAPPRREA